MKKTIAEAKEVRKPLDQIVPNDFGIRKESLYDEDPYDQTQSSIESVGVMLPILVRPHGKLKQIIAGERRWRKSQDAGERNIPCKIIPCNDEQARLLSLIENITRKELFSEEQARNLLKVKEDYERKHPGAKRGGRHTEEGFVGSIAKAVGKSEEWVRGKLQDAEMEQQIKGSKPNNLDLSKIPATQRELIAKNFKDEKDRIGLLKYTFEKNPSQEDLMKKIHYVKSGGKVSNLTKEIMPIEFMEKIDKIYSELKNTSKLKVRLDDVQREIVVKKLRELSKLTIEMIDKIT